MTREVYFDSRDRPIAIEHVLASAAFPPAFPPVEIDGEWYWDGGIVSSTPLDVVIDDHPRRSTLVFMVDLFAGRGILPSTMDEVAERHKDITCHPLRPQHRGAPDHPRPAPGGQRHVGTVAARCPRRSPLAGAAAGRCRRRHPRAPRPQPVA